VYAGHVGVALGAKGIRSTLPPWALIVASQLPDWTDATLCIAGLKSSTPGMLSHSFPAIGILTLLSGLAYLAATRDVIGSAFIGGLVISHALGDYLTGAKPTWNGGPMIGLQLYHHPAIDFALEAAVILAGWALYRTSFSRDRRNSREVFSILGVLLALQLAADIVFATISGLRKC
jgi:hypothetical protein